LGIRILVYHGVFSSEKEIFGDSREWIHKDTFEQHCMILKERGLYSISMDEYYGSILNNKLPPNAIILTFDDAQIGQLKYAVPILAKYGFIATFFLPVSWLNRSNRLTNKDITEISLAGIEIGSHSLTHSDFRFLDYNEINKELSNSKDYLEQLIAKSVNHFSYPWGRGIKINRDLFRKNNYITAVTVNRGVNNLFTDCYALYRIGIYGHTKDHSFKKLISQNYFPKYYLIRYSGDFFEKIVGKETKENIFKRIHRFQERKRFK
jgi:peptidoglycan/xylan/chitin deacetylase (PgdA/CDA1 family)